MQDKIAKIYKEDSPKALATLIRILGDIELAEEALHEAFSIALEKWPMEGIPQNPYSWLVSTGKFKTIDSLRRKQRGDELIAENFSSNGEYIPLQDSLEESIVDDDQLRLLFYCCHPTLPLDSRIALSLRDVCGMSTKEIANAYLVSTETIKKRISRAKSLFREKNISYEIPNKAALDKRLDAVLHVIYLIFNEGYSASSGEQHIRKDLTDEAIFLCRKLVELISSPESLGLLALLLIQEARRKSRTNENGDLISLEEQDRSLWNRELINEGMELIQQAILSGPLGPYSLQATIVSVHANAESVENTRWDIIVHYYDMLLKINPSPVVELNRAIAIGMQEGPQKGINLLTTLEEKGKLNNYHLFYSAKAELYKKLKLNNEASKAYAKAIKLAEQEPEKRYLREQLKKI